MCSQNTLYLSYHIKIFISCHQGEYRQFFGSGSEPNLSKRAFQIYQENRRNQNGICPNSCNFTDVNLNPPIVENSQKSTAETVFYFKRDIKTSNEYFIYTELSMIAEIGGYVGLMLGVSFINIGNLINKLLDKMTY